MNAKREKLKCNSKSFKFGQQLLFIHSTLCKSLIAFVLVSTLLGTAAVAGDLEKKFFFRRHYGIKVMSQNLYLGADISRVTQAKTLEEIPLRVAEAFEILLRNNIHERAEAIAGQIAELRPHLIGLQEVSLFRRQSPSDFFIGNPTQAEDVEFDYLEILLGALRDRKLKYEPVAIAVNSDIELPMLSVGEDGNPIYDDLRITDRDVILARSNLKITNIIEGNYSSENNLQIPIGELTRGYCAVETRIRRRVYRFINTHLEPRGSKCGADECQWRQAQELMTIFQNGDDPTILVGDFNSGSEDDDSHAYSVIRQAGFVDVWNRRRWHNDPGNTCCQDEDLRNENSVLYERVDLVFVRNDLGVLPFSIIGPARIFTVGDDTADKTASGLWPSDHAGVFARLRIPYLDFWF